MQKSINLICSCLQGCCFFMYFIYCYCNSAFGMLNFLDFHKMPKMYVNVCSFGDFHKMPKIIYLHTGMCCF